MIKKTGELLKQDQQLQSHNPSLEFIKMRGARSHRVQGEGNKHADSMLAVYKDRLTYTFIFEGDVASVHFNRSKQEIFFKGHNIKNMELTEAQILVLGHLAGILERDSQGRAMHDEYEATLARLLADK